MITNAGRFTRPPEQPFHDRPSRPQSFNRAPGADRRYSQAPRQPDEVLFRAELETPRKKFVLSRRKNAAGEFVRIEEFKGDRRDMVIVPAEHAAEFAKLLQGVCKPA